MSSSLASKKAHAVVSIYQNVGQIVGNHEVDKLFCRLCVRPSILVVVGDAQASCFCRFLEAFVVVGVAATAILNAVHVVVVVNHFMEQGGANLFDGS